MSQSMTVSQKAINYHYYAIIPQIDASNIFMLPSDNGWTLPHFAQSERRFWQDVSHVNQSLHDLFGIEVTTLRCMAMDYEPETEDVLKVYAMENRSPDWRPPASGRWISRDDLENLPLTVPNHRAVLADWFAWINTSTSNPKRAPWFESGWFDRASAWVESQLDRLGLDATGPVEQVRSWQRSALLRVNTSSGACYFKAVPPMFDHEPRLTQTLATWNPAYVPNVLTIDPQQRWILMRDFGGATLDQITEIERWEEAVQVFAQLQIEWAKQVDHLIDLGCPDRRLSHLAAQLDALFADAAAMLPGRPAGLSAKEMLQLRAFAPRLKAMCAELANYRLPRSLEHGDFWAGQIGISNGNYVFIDWSDSSIAHPFFSMLFFLVEIEDFFPKIRNVRTRLRNAYLQPWTCYAPLDQLITAFELSQPLAALHHALIYHRLVLPNMEFKWEMELMLPFYLKMLLRFARQDHS
jgi:hypothetical protein